MRRISIAGFVGLLLFLGTGLFAQTSVIGGGAVNSGTTLPTSCAVGDLFFKTDETAGQNVYGCTAPDTWTVQAGGGGGGDVYTSTANTFIRGQSVIGSADEIQLKVKGFSAQTNPVVKVTKSDDTVILQIDGDGTIQLGSGSGTTAETEQAAPGSPPSAGTLYTWADSTNHGNWSEDHASVTYRDATPTAATSGQFFTAFNSDGTFTKAKPTVTYSPGASFYNGGSDLTAGQTWYFTAPYACTIAAWNIVVDAGTATVDVWKVASGTAKPTVSDAITASAKPAIASGTALHSTTMTGWCGTGSCTVTKNDIFAFYLDTVSGVKNLDFTMEPWSATNETPGNLAGLTGDSVAGHGLLLQRLRVRRHGVHFWFRWNIFHSGNHKEVWVLCLEG